MLRLISILIVFSFALLAEQSTELLVFQEAEASGIAGAMTFNNVQPADIPSSNAEPVNDLAREIIDIETKGGREAPIILPRAYCESDRVRAGRMFVLFKKADIEACLSVSSSQPVLLGDIDVESWLVGVTVHSKNCGCTALLVNTGE